MIQYYSLVRKTSNDLSGKFEAVYKLVVLCDSKRGETSMLNTIFIAHVKARVHLGMLDYITIKCE